jgi:RNA polymerase sigma-70 factor, ECF subfamily
MMFQIVGLNIENEAFGIEYMDALYGYALMLTRHNPLGCGKASR